MVTEFDGEDELGDLSYLHPVGQRIARLPDAERLRYVRADRWIARQVTLSLGGSLHDPTDPIGRLLFSACLDSSAVCLGRRKPWATWAKPVGASAVPGAVVCQS